MYLGALSVFAPEIWSPRSNQWTARGAKAPHLPRRRELRRLPADSIDYAVMEKAPRVAVVPVSMGWSDVGSWDALHAISNPDAGGNVVRGDVVAIEASNCLVQSEPGKRVALVGVKDLIVVVSGADALVLPRGRSQEVKKLIDAMKE